MTILIETTYFKLFYLKQIGVYGDILKVKIMYNRRDNALMQFKTYEQAFTGKYFFFSL